MWNAKDVCEEMIDDDGPPPPIPVDPVEGEGETDVVVVDGEEGAEAVEGEGEEEGEEGPADESEPVQVTIYKTDFLYPLLVTYILYNEAKPGLKGRK